MMQRILPGKYLSVLIVLAALMLVIVAPGASADTTDSSVYGAGEYSNCNYGTCTITLLSGGSTSIDVLPDAAGKCTINSDTASVLTDATNGYTLTMTTGGTNNSLVGGSTSIPASSGTGAAPAVLANNTWGYRVDGVDNFGIGPTSAQSNISTPSLTFAGVPASNQAGAVVATTSSPANPADDTTVWYGTCIEASVPADDYSTTILYTAVVN